MAKPRHQPERGRGNPYPKLREKYKGRSPEEFSDFYHQQRCFWYQEMVAYPEDKIKRKALMRKVAVTAHCFMYLRKTLGLREYDWTKRAPFFFNLVFSTKLWEKSVKRMVQLSAQRYERAIRYAPRVVTLEYATLKKANDQTKSYDQRPERPNSRSRCP